MQIKQTFESPTKGGFSDTRLRLFIFMFMTIGLLLTPALGILAAFSIVMLFGIFTAFKIAEFQSTNSRSIWLHRQAMDRMYGYSKNAEYISRRLADLDRRDARINAKQVKHVVLAKNEKRIEISGNLNLVLSR
ncbi:MAG: hypothetical protein WCQ49_00765 [Candidatus Saccharibacteria bacterium]